MVGIEKRLCCSPGRSWPLRCPKVIATKYLSPTSFLSLFFHQIHPHLKTISTSSVIWFVINVRSIHSLVNKLRLKITCTFIWLPWYRRLNSQWYFCLATIGLLCQIMFPRCVSIPNYPFHRGAADVIYNFGNLTLTKIPISSIFHDQPRPLRSFIRLGFHTLEASIHNNHL